MIDLDDLAAFLARSSRLDAGDARRVLAEIVAQLSTETVEQFVLRRHRALKEQDAERNEAIYRRIAEEVASRPFAVARLSERQIRRLIYG